MKKLFSRLSIAFDQSFSHSVLSQFKWLGGVVVITFVFLMVMSLFLYDSSMEDDGSRGLIVDTIMLLFDPGCMTDRMSSTYVIMTALCGIIIFMGMFIPIVSNVLERRTDAVLSGAVSYDLENHHVILGYNKSIPALIRFIREKMKDDLYIVLMSEQLTEDVRANIQVNLGQNIGKKLVILNGKRNAREDLERLSIRDAKSLWIIGEEDEEGHDSINFECAEITSQLRNGRTPLDCHIMFTQPSLYSCFQYSDITEAMHKNLNFLPFNPYENWAKKIFVAGPEQEEEAKFFTPIDSVNGIAKDSPKHVHLIVIGMSRMGQALAVEAAHTAHYPNFKEDDMTTRTHITFIDSNAEEEMYKFKTRFSGMFELVTSRYADTTEEGWESEEWNDPMNNANSQHKHLGKNFIDVKWEFVNGMADSPAVHKYIADAVAEEDAITTIAVCLPNAEESLRISLNLPYQAYGCQQILVYQEVYSALLNNLSASKKKGNIRQFGAMSDYYDENKIGEEEGKWINFFYVDNTLSGADADVHWKNASVVNQWSSIHSANIVYTKLRCIGLTADANADVIKKAFEDNMDDLMVLEHNRWNVDKLLTGFRALTDQEYSDVKSGKVAKKTLKNEDYAHLDICSFDQLRDDDPDTIQSDIDVTMALVTILKEKIKK